MDNTIYNSLSGNVTKHFGVKKLADINITKGHNIQISGEPSDHVASFEPLNQVAIHPYRSRVLSQSSLSRRGTRSNVGSQFLLQNLTKISPFHLLEAEQLVRLSMVSEDE